MTFVTPVLHALCDGVRLPRRHPSQGDLLEGSGGAERCVVARVACWNGEAGESLELGDFLTRVQPILLEA